MSGHSKWATIKRQKGAKDIKRGQIFTKLSNAITIAVKQGGGATDLEGNFKLRLAVEAARSANMPKENIERAIFRASAKQEARLEEAIYEGFGPGGFSIIVEAFTDNKQRTFSEVKNIFDKYGGSLGLQGAVMYQFERRGMLSIEYTGKSLEDVFLIAADSGALDIINQGTETLIYTRPDDLAKIRSFLTEKGINILSCELIYKAINPFSILEKNDVQRARVFVERLEELGDVANIYTNL